MLNLAKLAQQLPNITQQMSKEAIISRERVNQAEILLHQAQTKLDQLLEIQQEWRQGLIFSCATPVESLETRKAVAIPQTSHSVFATDGSQIAPSHHEIAYCYLINIGRIMLHYGQNLHPLLDSIPEIYYKPEDLYISKQWGIRVEEWMSYRRTVSEIEILANMATDWVKPPGAHKEQNLALVDGSLVYWFLDNLPLEARDLILPSILTAWEELKVNQIPLVGYVSASRSVEAIHFLRLQSCPYPNPNCKQHCAEITEKTPCQTVEPLRDATFWAHLLQPGERSPLWRSNLKILEWYGETQQIYFCYLHVGTEVARVELPAWVALNETLLEQSLSIVLAQVYKGFGYPIALSEAHNQAVVRGGDRARFFALLEEQMIRSGLKNVGISYKESSKRNSIA